MGYGRELGSAGIKEFTNHKVITTAGVGQLARAPFHHRTIK